MYQRQGVDGYGKTTTNEDTVRSMDMLTDSITLLVVVPFGLHVHFLLNPDIRYR